MPTTYDSVTGLPTYEIPGAEPDETETPRTAEQEERLEAILTKMEALVKEVQAELQALKDRTAAALEALKASVDAHFERLTKTD
jgi:hypothetical protein